MGAWSQQREGREGFREEVLQGGKGGEDFNEGA